MLSVTRAGFANRLWPRRVRISTPPCVACRADIQFEPSYVSKREPLQGSDLLELIGNASPTFFEKLVLDLLHAMGYGTSRADLQRVGASGDGGIDGIISLDRLGSPAGWRFSYSARV